MPLHVSHIMKRQGRSMLGTLGVLAIAGAIAGPASAASGHRNHSSGHRARPAGGEPVSAQHHCPTNCASPQEKAAVESLVRDGTINRTQANAIEAQLAAGSVNPIQLVHSGVVTEAQMRAVALALDNVKRSLRG